MARSGTTGFKSFAANLLRVRKIEAQIAQQSMLNREGFRASLTEQASDGKPNLTALYDRHRSSDVSR